MHAKTNHVDGRIFKSEDEIIGVVQAETMGDEIILDEFIDDDGKSSAKMLGITFIAGLVGFAVTILAIIIKMLR